VLRSTDTPGTPGADGAVRTRRGGDTVLLVGALATASFLQWTGSSAVLPLLPVYLVRRGTSAGTVGLVIGAFFVGGFLAQYLAGRLADRIGYRPVLLLGLVGYAIASAGFLLDVGSAGYAGLRAGQGAAAGAAQVAGLALVASRVARDRRGRAFSVLYGAQLGGMAAGPVFGGLVGLNGMAMLFVAAAGGALVACVPVLLMRLSGRDDVVPHGVEPTEPDPTEPDPDAGRLTWTGVLGRALVGVLLAAGFEGLMTGVYEACWSMLLDLRHAATWQIGASWTLFAIPFVVVSPLAGWLADHRDRRTLVIVASATSIGFCVAYPFLPSPSWLLGLGVFEAIGVAAAMPAAQSLLADAAPADAAGRAQGLFASVTTACVAVTALVAGGLFGIAPWLPFVTAGVVGTGLVAALPVVWRGVPGRVH
jgi:DHA1 family multidrug resistance protein-like MFS transporter